MAEHTFNDLHALYDGVGLGWHEPDESGGWDGGWREKRLGEQFSAKIYVDHTGPGSWFDVGIGIDCTVDGIHGPIWAVKNVWMGPDYVPGTYEIIVSGTWTAMLDLNRRVDILKFVQTTNGPRDIGGNGFIIADWDRQVYYQGSVPETSVTVVDGNTYYAKNGGTWIHQDNAHIGMSNGDTWNVKGSFMHTGMPGLVTAGAYIDYTPINTTAQVSVPVTDDSSSKEYPFTVSGIWNTDLPNDRDVDVYKFAGNSENSDKEVFYTIAGNVVDVVDGTTLYSRNGGTPIHQDSAHIGMSNGDTWGVYFQITHKGSPGTVVAGIEIDYTPHPTIVRKSVPVNADWVTATYDVFISGIWDTDLPDDRDVDVYKFVELANGSNYTENSDKEVYYTVVSPPPDCLIDSDCLPGYECKNGVCVKKPCTSDDDCPDNYVCEDGICVYVEPSGNWLSKYYLYLGAGGMLIAGGILLTTGKRKKK